MLNTTFRLAKQAGMYPASYQKFAYAKGGVRKYGEDTPIPLTDVLDVLGLRNALWVLDNCTLENSWLFRMSLAVDYAERVLPFCGNKRLREYIETEKRCIMGIATAEGLERAGAEFATRIAAWAADRATIARGDYDWGKERKWQAQHLREMLEKEKGVKCVV